MTEKSKQRIESYQARVKEAEMQLANPLKPPVWTQSFRLGAQENQQLKLPNAYDDFKSALSPELQARIDDIYDASGPKEGMSWDGRSLRALANLVMTSPKAILNLEGVNQAMMDELVRVLRDKGHLADQ